MFCIYGMAWRTPGSSVSPKSSRSAPREVQQLESIWLFSTETSSKCMCIRSYTNSLFVVMSLPLHNPLFSRTSTALVASWIGESCVCVTLLPTHFHPFPADSEEQGRNGRHRTLEALFHACGMPLLWSSRINQNCGIMKNVSWKRYWYFALHPWVQRMCRLPALYCTPHIKVPGTLFAWNPEVEKNLTN